MSALVSNAQILTGTLLAANKSAIIDCEDVDVLSIQVVSTAQTGSNIIALYESVDGVNYVAISGDTVTITTTPTNTIWHLSPVYSKWVKVLFTAGSGSVTFAVSMSARNNSTTSSGFNVPVTLATA